MLKVLVVEDEEIIRRGLVHTVDWLSMGCTVVGDAGDGQEGLQLIQQLRPDLVITDIRMPVMNGIEMVEQALRIFPLHSIILTSYSEFEYAKRAISLKVFEYLLKPVDEVKLAGVIENIKREIRQDKVFDDIIKKTKNIDEFNLIALDVYLFAENKLNYYVSETIKRIKNDYHQKLSIEGIADELGVSPSYLSRKFKEATSQTFLDILYKYRIQKAVELLETGKCRIYEISDLTGFSEYKNFCNVFKKYTGTSPTDFMKSGNCAVVINQSKEVIEDMK
ncbi:response regulator transcription factor [Paenibacillus aceris]|uniref:Two-component system response regulator YesN n=1 Tax=Paenibacillus aceris TaxID=869555 RepID=A0ABS4I633_9BACL|nr:response regulator [Paenibacillus aceris]MBP1966185.1 two-component system response regulator YesN [Paenibacillus aceris]NHW33340.1 response regulator [Paenibacillus aceris]